MTASDPAPREGSARFRLEATSGRARAGTLETSHGPIRTPIFMPVGTQATVKAMYGDQLRAAGADIILANTYHLMLRPGAERVEALGGLHRFMNWPHPILSDSGGFQVMSLAALSKRDADGVTFKSHLDGSTHRLTPERSVEIQRQLGVDIVMQFDECLSLPASRDEIARAMELSLDWGERCRRAFVTDGHQALFGIVQGGDDLGLRRRSAERTVEVGFDGYAVGGLAVGEPQETMLAVLRETLPWLPAGRPRYLMGVGTPADILLSVAEGIDMFDCVMPTRAGRHGLAFTRGGRVNLRNAVHRDDPGPLDPEGASPAATDYSRAYLHHLVRAGETLGAMLLTWNNVAYYLDLVRRAREAIFADRYADFVEEELALTGGVGRPRSDAVTRAARNPLRADTR